MSNHLLKKMGHALALAGLWIVAATLAASGTLEAGSRSQVRSQGCRDVSLSKSPGWTISGSWSDQGTTLLVVDAFRNEVLRYSNQGKLLGVLPSAKEAIINFTPSVIKAQDSNYILELANARMIRLGKDLRPIAEHNLIEESRRPGESLQGIFQWDLAGNEAVVFGDVLRTSPGKAGEEIQTWKSGLFRVPIENASSFRSLHEISPDDPLRLFYRLGTPLIASLGNTSYILLMEEHPRIVKNRKGSEKLEPLRAFPPGFDTRPFLPSWKKFDEYARVMQAVEASSMPVALFGWENHLYVVGRHAEEGRTRWSLTKIDPRSEVVLWTTTIHLSPTAHHVTVVPGPREWAWIQKGTVRGLFNQDVESILFLPASNLRKAPGQSLCQ